MAAIHISEKRAWVAARWVVEFVLRALLAHLPSDSTATRAVQQSISNGGDWLDLTALEADSRKQIGDAIISVRRELERSTDADFATKEGRDALLARTLELVELMKSGNDLPDREG